MVALLLAAETNVPGEFFRLIAFGQACSIAPFKEATHRYGGGGSIANVATVNVARNTPIA